MLKVQILASSSHCNGKAYLPMGEVDDNQGHKYTRHSPYPFCEGNGNEQKWIDIQDFTRLFHQPVCSSI